LSASSSRILFSIRFAVIGTLLLGWHELGALAFIIRKYMQTRGFT